MKERKKSPLKNMTFKEKVDHIWEYYRIHILVSAMVLFFVGSMLNHLVFNPPKDAGIYVAFLGRFMDMEEIEDLQDRLTEEIVKDETEKTEGKVEFFMLDYDRVEMAEMNMVTVQKLMAMFTSKEIDIMIADPANFHAYVQQQAFIPLTEVFTEEELKPWEEYWFMTKGETDTEPQLYGLSIEGNQIIEKVRFIDERPIIGVISNTTRMDKSKETIQWFMEQQ